MKYLMTYEFFLESIIDDIKNISNYAPLYHITNIESALEILISNKLILGLDYYPMFNDNLDKKAISFTRNRNLKSVNYKNGVIFCLDANKIRFNYKIDPYDYFCVYTKNDYFKLSKSNIDRIDPNESEEIIYKDINELSKYLFYIDFSDENFILDNLDLIKDYSKKYNIDILLNGLEYDING